MVRGTKEDPIPDMIKLTFVSVQSWIIYSYVDWFFD